MAGRGYVKLHRDVMDHPIFAHEGLLRLWCYCLLRANWKDSQWLIPGTLISKPVKRGQFITGCNSLYDDLYGSKYKGDKCDKPSVRTIWRWLEALRDMNCLQMETVSSRCTLVTICNYETYQGDDTTECQGDDTLVSSSCHAGVTPVTTNKETKKLRNTRTNTPISPNSAVGRRKPVREDRDYSAEFLEFWFVFPNVRKGAKPLAWEAWQRAVERAPAATILAAAIEFAASPKGRSGYCPGPAPWLNQDRWDDDRASWQFDGTTTASEPPKPTGPVNTFAPRQNLPPIPVKGTPAA